MIFAKILNNNVVIYPYTWTNLQLDNPSTSFPKSLTDIELLEYGVVAINETRKPAETATTAVIEGMPVNENNIWTQTWIIIPISTEASQYRAEQQSLIIRSQRNSLLLHTDWTQTKDVSEKVSESWAPYRQALRDITLQPGFPFEVTWPTKPE